MGATHHNTLILAGLAGMISVGCSQGPRHSAPASTAAAVASGNATSYQANTSTSYTTPDGLQVSAAPLQVTSVVASTGPGTTSPGVTPRVERDAFTDFGESDVVDAQAESAGDLMYIVEANGTFRVVDTASMELVRAFPLFASPLTPGRSVRQLTLVSPELAVIPTQGEGFEGLALLDPRTAQSSVDVQWFDLGGLSATWPAGSRNSQGVDVGERPLQLTEITGVTLVGESVFLCAANSDAAGDHNPGAVVALRLNQQERRLEARALIRTSAYNPTGLTRIGEQLLVTNSGSFGQTGASIDVIDVQSAKRVGTVSFPERLPDGRVPDPFGPVVVDPSGRYGYVGSMTQARLYTVDLSQQTYVEDLELPSQSTRNSTEDLTFAGDKLYVANQGDAALNVVDLEQQSVTRVAGFERESDASGQAQLDALVVKESSDGTGEVLAVVNDAPANGSTERQPTLDKLAVR